MKKLLYIIICVITAWSCNEISEDERFVYVKPAEVNRNVLLEDFTGQRCVNCPAAVDEIHKIQELYGADHIIAVSIHGGPMAVRTNSSVIGLRTDLADTYYQASNIEANPMGVINRSGEAITPDQWQAAVSKAIQQTSPIEIAVQFMVDGNTLKTSVDVTSLTGSISGNLQVWILEDNITAMQLMSDGSPNADYIHNHVLRAAVNGVWGEDISLKEADSKHLDYTTPIDGTWAKENLSAVVFVYNSKEVLQVVKAEIAK